MISLNSLKYLIMGIIYSELIFFIISTLGLFLTMPSYLIGLVLMLMGLSLGILISRIHIKKYLDDSLWIFGIVGISFLNIVFNIDISNYTGYLGIGLLIGLLIILINKFDKNKPNRSKLLKNKHYKKLRWIPIISLFVAGISILPIFEITSHTNQQTLASLYFIVMAFSVYLKDIPQASGNLKTLFLGPRSSGKSVLAMGLYSIIPKVYSGSSKFESNDIWYDGKPVSIVDMYTAFMERGYRGIESTLVFTVHNFILRSNLPNSLKNKGINEATMELLDYRGEYIETVSELMKSSEKYDEKLSELESQLNSYVGDEKLVSKIIKDLKTGKFRNFLDYMPKNKWKEATNPELMGALYIISRIKSSNNLVFLLDGKKLLDYMADRVGTLSALKERDPEFYRNIKRDKTNEPTSIFRDFGNFASMMGHIGSRITRKKVFLVVTKSDVILEAIKKAEYLKNPEMEIELDYGDIHDIITDTLLEDPHMNSICNEAFGVNVDKKYIKNQLFLLSIRENREPNGIKELIDKILRG